MPTMILTFAWLLAATTTVVAAPAPAAITSDVVAFTPVVMPTVVGVPLGGAESQPGWLLFESDTDEETDDTDDAGLDPRPTTWPEPRMPFGVAGSNPHPTVLPRSALRSPILRC